jgi:hypothetical protein
LREIFESFIKFLRDMCSEMGNSDLLQLNNWYICYTLV